MKTQELVADIALGVIGGYIGTKAMEKVSMQLYKMEPEEARQQEDAVRPGPPYQIAAQKVTHALDLDLSEQQIKKSGMAFHYGLGMGWGPVYTLLRRMTGMHPVAAGLLTGAAMSLIVDEGLTPALGFSAPNREYPAVTHVRGFAAHLVFGLAVAAIAELLAQLGESYQ